jgi:hypothetical protein
MRERDLAVLGARAAVDVAQGARALALAPLPGQRFVPAPPTAGDGGAGDALGEGSGRVEETVHLFQAEASRESVFGLCAHEVEGLPVAFKDVVGEAAESTGAEAHGAWSEAVAMLAVSDLVLPCLCREKARRLAGALSQQAYRTDRALLRALALATELERRDHVLTQRGHEIAPFVRRVVCLRRKTSETDEGRKRGQDRLREPNWRLTLLTRCSMPSNNANHLLSCCFVATEHL